MNLFLSFYLKTFTIWHFVSFEAETQYSDNDFPAELLNEINENEINVSSIELTPAVFHWPKGEIPFFIDLKSYDELIWRRIAVAMTIIQADSCVVFKRMEVEAPEFSNYMWLSIQNPTKIRRCIHRILHSANGKATMIIGFECMQTHQILHTLMHAIGFHDEITHPQRDTYVSIIWPNIQPEYRSLFWMRSRDKMTEMEYDTTSIMHFHDRAFSSNGGPTIVPLVPGLKIKPADTLSQLDVMKLQVMFGRDCNKRKVKNLYETCQAVMGEGDKPEDGESDTLEDGEGDIPEDDQGDEGDQDGTDVPNDRNDDGSNSNRSEDDGEVVVLDPSEKTIEDNAPSS